jgi:adenine/guanine phosphoribosyltransferase-like PRPP-binding protein
MDTGGSCKAVGELIEQSGGKVLEYMFCIVSLCDLCTVAANGTFARKFHS